MLLNAFCLGSLEWMALFCVVSVCGKSGHLHGDCGGWLRRELNEKASEAGVRCLVPGHIKMSPP